MQLQGKSKKIVFPRHRFACLILAISAFSPSMLFGQINTDRVLLMGRNALYYEDYVLAIQRFNMVINAKPWLGEPYFFRGLAKFYLEDGQTLTDKQNGGAAYEGESPKRCFYCRKNQMLSIAGEKTNEACVLNVIDTFSKKTDVKVRRTKPLQRLLPDAVAITQESH